jgi:hypothetical protein
VSVIAYKYKEQLQPCPSDLLVDFFCLSAYLRPAVRHFEWLLFPDTQLKNIIRLLFYTYFSQYPVLIYFWTSVHFSSLCEPLYSCLGDTWSYSCRFHMPVRLPKISNYTLWMIITLFPYTIQENYKALLLDILFYVFTSHFSVNCSSSVKQLSICISTCAFLFILYYRNTNSEKMETSYYPRLCARWTPQTTTIKAGNPTAATRPTDRSYSYLNQVAWLLQSPLDAAASTCSYPCIIVHPDEI